MTFDSFRGGLVAVLACAASGCATKAGDPIPQARTHDECMAQKGVWRKSCRDQRYYCVRPHPDGGKACRGKSDCEGRCIVDMTITCSEVGKCAEPGSPEVGQSVNGTCEVDRYWCRSTVVLVEDGKVSEIILHDSP
jgi:hypothetical protein